MRTYGNPRKRQNENPERCIVEVSDGIGWNKYQCGFRKKHGDLCGVHNNQKLKGRKLNIPEDKE